MPQCCPVCELYISEAEIFDHVFGHCDTRDKSAGEVGSWLNEFFASCEGKQFSVDISCFKCNYTCQFDGEFVRHIVTDHVACSCGYDKCDGFRSLYEHLADSAENLKCKIVCPLCDVNFAKDTILAFPTHVLKCVPKSFEGNLVFDISDLYPLCIYCDPPKNILFTKLKAHLRDCHSKKLNEVFCAPRKKLSIANFSNR